MDTNTLYNIIIYEDKNGKSEVREYIKKIRNTNSKDGKIKFNKIIAYIRMLEQEGLMLKEPYIKHLNNNIWELRPLRDRIIFANIEKETFILLSVFMKQTQKTPQNEIEKAKRYLQDYKNRYEE